MTAARALKCGSCGNEIETCAFCDGPVCASPRCNNCMALAFKERIPQPPRPRRLSGVAVPSSETESLV
jgi:hypothetical protein